MDIQNCMSDWVISSAEKVGEACVHVNYSLLHIY